MSSLFTRYSAFTLLVFASLSLAVPHLSSREPGDSGYTSLPEVDGAILHTDWEMKGATFPLYLSSATTEGDTSAVKRAVIVVPGKWRDCWTHWELLDSSLQAYTEVPYEDVSIMAPCYLSDIDLEAGAATEDNILFGLTTWVSGQKNTLPTTVDTTAFDVADELINYYLDTDKFPALEAIVFAGHSAGGQMAQRYAALKKNATTTEDEGKVHYWAGNPGSFVWLIEDRPNPNEDCEGFDSYKYGLADNFPAYALEDANAMGRDALVERYQSRNVHYAFGARDTGAGDTRCQAKTQGASHLERGQNFVAMLEDSLGGLRATQTVDYIPGVSHDGPSMFNSDLGREKLFSYL